MNLFKTMAGLLIDERQSRQSAVTGTINDVNAQYEAMNQMELGTFTSRNKLPRTRQQIFTMWEIMQKDRVSTKHHIAIPMIMILKISQNTAFFRSAFSSLFTSQLS